jgi:hypothetical protein
MAKFGSRSGRNAWQSQEPVSTQVKNADRPLEELYAHIPDKIPEVNVSSSDAIEQTVNMLLLTEGAKRPPESDVLHVKVSSSRWQAVADSLINERKERMAWGNGAKAATGSAKKNAQAGESHRHHQETPSAEEAESAENRFSRFMKNEKWMGKKGLVFSGAAVVIGAMLVGINRMLAPRDEREIEVVR